MVSSGAFWVAISCHLAALPVLPESEVRVELKFIGDRSGILGTIILLPEENWGQKNDKNGPKIDKNCAKIALFLYIFRICSLKIGQKTLYWTENRPYDSSESVKRVIPKITSWKSRGARAPVPHSWRRQWIMCVVLLEVLILASDD